MQEPIAISGLWLRVIGDRIEVLVEIDKAWRLVIQEATGTTIEAGIGHIANPSGIRKAPPDPLQDARRP
jgi:hypothetical protein